MKKRKAVRRDAASAEHHGSDWERGAPEWTPARRPEGGEPGDPARKDEDVSAPSKPGDPPIEQPFGERSRHGGRVPDAEP